MKQIDSFKHCSCHMCLFKDIKITVWRTSSNQEWNIARRDLQCHRRKNHSTTPLGDTALSYVLHFAPHLFLFVLWVLCLASCATLPHPLSQFNLKYHQAEVLRTTYPIPHTACLVPRTSCPVPCTSYPAPRTSYLVPRTWYTIPGQPRALFKLYLKH
jgi:hypothetical protein